MWNGLDAGDLHGSHFSFLQFVEASRPPAEIGIRVKCGAPICGGGPDDLHLLGGANPHSTSMNRANSSGVSRIGSRTCVDQHPLAHGRLAVDGNDLVMQPLDDRGPACRAGTMNPVPPP